MKGSGRGRGVRGEEWGGVEVKQEMKEQENKNCSNSSSID